MEVNEKLKEHNLRLSGYSFLMPDFKPVFTINTEWIDEAKVPRGKKKWPTSMFVSHCPFCGNPVKEDPEKTQASSNASV
jgi:hypothetical protein